MKQIIVVKPNSISKEDKGNLEKNGCIVIESESPDQLRIINSYEGLEGDDIFNAAIKTIADTGLHSAVRTLFAENLLKVFKLKVIGK